MKSLLKCILKKHYDRQLEADQNEFIETHYREVENMYQKMRGYAPFAEESCIIAHTVLTTENSGIVYAV